MGEIRKRTYRFCTVCGQQATKACRLEEHATESRTWPTWWIRYYRDGMRHEESSGSTKKTEAERLLKQREGAIANGVAITPKIGRLTFDEAAEDLLNDYRANRKRSLKDVEHHLEAALTPTFGGRRLSAITTTDIRAYVVTRQEAGYSNATINRELSALGRMFTLALQARKLLSRPHIEHLQEDNARKGFFEPKQFAAVRQQLPSVYQAIATLAYYTGWRTISEILTLEWHQIDQNAGVIRLEPGTTKNREGRMFVYGELAAVKATIEELWTRQVAFQKRGHMTPFVFGRYSKKKGAVVRIKSFYKRWRSACKAADVPGRILHDFRRTAVRNLTRAGVPDTVSMKVTGHKTRAVFDRYDITSEEDLALAARKLQALTGTVSGTVGESDAEALRARLANSR